MSEEPWVTWLIPIRLQSEGNINEHWGKKQTRKKQQDKHLWLENVNMSANLEADRRVLPYPCVVKFTRYGIRLLDDDNLVYAFKHIRDVVASYIKPGLAPGQADSDEKIKWIYEQKTGKGYSIRIDFYKGS